LNYRGRNAGMVAHHQGFTSRESGSRRRKRDE